MRVECESCQRLVEIGGLQPLDGALGFQCPACGATNRLATATSPAPEAARPTPTLTKPPANPPTSEAESATGPRPGRTGSDHAPAPPATAAPAATKPPGPRPPEGARTCPKCGHVQNDDYACHRCGLVFARYTAGTAASFDPLAGHPLADAIRARWADIRDRLDDEAAHEAFVRLCVEHDLLDFAGTCYRRLTPAGAVEDPRVARYRERVVQLALTRIARVEGRRTQALSHRLRVLMLLTFVALIGLAFAAGYYLIAHAPVRPDF